MTAEHIAELHFRSARVEHALMPPHEPDGYTTRSEAFAIGVSFTGHKRAVIEDSLGRRLERSFPPGTAGINGPDPITWLRVNEPSEAMEIHPTDDELSAVAKEFGVAWHERSEFEHVEHDPAIWGICARFRTAALGAEPMTELEADGLTQSLLAHVAVRYFGAQRPRPIRGRLDARRLSRVIEFLENTLHRPPGLREMADVAAMSPFHFQRLFRAAVGLSPHAYVMARRMERARRMLMLPGTKVADVARELGFSDLSHFRRSFRRQFHAAPRNRA